MTLAMIKEKLHHYIEVADEKKLAAIYTILQEEIDGEYFYSEEEIKLFYDRRQKHLSGESQSYTVEEAHSLVRRNSKSNGL
jgi:hypothetical protein